MKHAWKKLLAAAVLPCLLAGCGALGGPESEVPSMDHLLGLTQEQRLEDYDYLVQTLGDSYLCMGVRDRDNPEDPSAAIFQAYREMIQESDSDEVFYSAVYSTLFRLGTYGHLWIDPAHPGDGQGHPPLCGGGLRHPHERLRPG